MQEIETATQTTDDVVAAARELQIIANNIPVLISYVDHNLIYRFVNRQYCEQWGTTTAKIVGSPVRDVLGEQAFLEAEPRLRQALAGQPVVYELLVPATTRNPFWASVTYTPDIRNGKVAGVYVTVIDTTPLKEAENRFERALAGTGDGFYDWSIESPEFFASAEFLKTIGQPVPQSGISLKTFFKAVHPDDLKRVQEQIRKHVNGETDIYQSEYRLRTGDGKYEWFLARGRISPDAIGQQQHFAGSLQNIQNRKSLELKLRDQVRERDQFLAVLSHELRNPLNAVIAAAGLARQTQDDATRSECLDVLERQAEHMHRLLDDLLDASRITNNKLHLRKEVIDLAAVLDDTSTLTMATAREKKVRLDITRPEEMILISADHHRIVQCISNLVTNGIKYSRPGDRVVVAAVVQNESVLITVRDTGIGMTPEVCNRAFDLFSQADESIAHSDGGMGVGLSLVQTVCQLHGGTVTGHSDGPGKGSSFTICLPLYGGPALTSDISIPTATHSVSERDVDRIVVIDDLHDGRRMLAETLRDEGYTIFEAADGQTGLSLTAEYQPQAVLTDIGLPDISGYDVARQLRSGREQENLLLIALTGYGQKTDRKQAIDAGFDFHLVKPVNLTRLLNILASWSSRQLSSVE